SRPFRSLWPLPNLAALSLGFGVRLEFLEVGPDLGAVHRIELSIGFARLARLPELHQRLAEIKERIRRSLALRVVPIVRKERLSSGARLALVEERPADEIVGIACAAMFGISRSEGSQRRDRCVILARFPQAESFGVGVFAGIAA